MLHLNCWEGLSKVGMGCSGFGIGLDVVCGGVGVTFWLIAYLWSVHSESNECLVFLVAIQS